MSETILEKIRRTTPKKTGPLARARKVNGRDSAGLTQTATEILAKYLPAAARAWVAGLKANKAIFNSKTGVFEETNVADHKVRAECAREIWHNVIGRPIERSMQVSGNYKELSQVLEELRASPEAVRLLGPDVFAAFANSEQSTTESKESEPVSEARPTPEGSEQKTG
jgi:hypothetical protein